MQITLKYHPRKTLGFWQQALSHDEKTTDWQKLTEHGGNDTWNAAFETIEMSPPPHRPITQMQEQLKRALSDNKMMPTTLI